MKRLVILIPFVLIASTNLYSSGISEAREKLYDAYIEGNNPLWIEVMNDLEKSYKKTKNVFILHELTKSQYGYIGMLIDKGDYKTAKLILPKAKENIEELLDYNEDWADVRGLRAGIYGFKIILYPNQVILKGPKGKLYLNKATSLKEITPSVLIEMANYKYHTPALLGGDIDDAIRYYKYAIRLFELTNQSSNNWQYVNAMVWLAISLDRKGESTEAKKVLQKLLKQEPEFVWVKDNLYPKILQNESISKIYYTSKD